MPVTFTNGDLFAVAAFVRVNPVNCVGVMGAGLALAFKRRYPAMFADYHRHCLLGLLQPGELVIWPNPEGGFIVSLPTKAHWRDPSTYAYVADGLKALRKFVQENVRVQNACIAVPALGCGLGGLAWPEVKVLIEKYLGDLSFNILVFEPEA